jgi:glycosyl transferase, family 25
MSSEQSKPPIFGAFDTVRIINLVHRTDRAADMRKQLRRVGMADDPRVAFFAAISSKDAAPFNSPGGRGGFLSYMTLLQQAAAADQSILIFEDDCDFLLPAIYDYRPPADMDVFYGGYVASNPDDLYDSDIIGAHFMGFSARAAKAAAAYFEHLLTPDFVGDARAMAQPDYDPAIRPLTDGALVWMRRAHPELKTEFAMLGIQRASRTDIGHQRFFDRIPVLRDVVELARRVRRIVRPRPEMANAQFGGTRR